MGDKITEENFNPKLHVKEYKRKCNECGKVWHSLASREKEILAAKTTANINQFTNACGCSPGASLQAQRNVQSSQDTLDKLKSCPECGSQNYAEEVSIYEKK